MPAESYSVLLEYRGQLLDEAVDSLMGKLERHGAVLSGGTGHERWSVRMTIDWCHDPLSAVESAMLIIAGVTSSSLVRGFTKRDLCRVEAVLHSDMEPVEEPSGMPQWISPSGLIPEEMTARAMERYGPALDALAEHDGPDIPPEGSQQIDSDRPHP